MTKSWNGTLLADTLGVILPDAEQTLVLQACLCEERRASESWRSWIASKPNLNAGLADSWPGLKRLLPLLHYNLAENGIALEESASAVLRAAAIWEERRAARVHEILGDVLAAVNSAGVSPIAWKGVALAETVYPQPWLRHCHDIDLLVSLHEVARADAALRDCGFSAAPSRLARRAHLSLVHDGGLPVCVHVDLPGAARLALPRSDMVAGAAEMTLAGRSAKVFRPTDTLLCLCAHLIAGRAHDCVCWVADATFLLRRSTPGEEEWARLAETAKASGLALPLHLMLSYLRDAIDVAVPNTAIARIGQRGASSKRRERDTLLLYARKGRRLGALLRRSGWRSRLEIVRWLVAPSPEFIKSWCMERGYRWSPLWYVARPMRRLVRRALGP